MELLALLTEMIERDAYNLYLAEGVMPVLRTGGDLAALDGEVIGEQEMAALVGQLPEIAQAIGPERCGGRTAIVAASGRIWRVESRTSCGRPTLFAHLIPESVPRLQELLGERHVLQEVAGRTRGLVLIAGDTGSGKTTTAASLVEQINLTRGGRRIVQLGADYRMTSKLSFITQHVVGIDCESLAEGLALAESVEADVVFTPDLPDSASVLQALRLAQWMLVIAVVHARSASETIETLVRQAAPAGDLARQRLAAGLQAIVVQRLLRRSPERGRVPAHEILMGTPAVRNRIAQGDDDIAGMIAAGRGEGMCSMDDSVLDLLERGMIAFETARGAVSDPGRLPLGPAD